MSARRRFDPGCCDECNGDGVYYVDGKEQRCICSEPQTTALTVGRKDDDTKPRWDLVPYDAMQEVVTVLEHGAKKYGDENWRNVANPKRRYFAAALRHLTAWWMGEARDADTGASHLAHAVCCFMFLIAIGKARAEARRGIPEELVGYLRKGDRVRDVRRFAVTRGDGEVLDVKFDSKGKPHIRVVFDSDIHRVIKKNGVIRKMQPKDVRLLTGENK